jgi:hypothetical protein
MGTSKITFKCSIAHIAPARHGQTPVSENFPPEISRKKHKNLSKNEENSA